MYSYDTSVLFVCRLCKDSFQLVDDFIKHKNEKHSVEFLTSNCIVFEDILIFNTNNDEGRSGMLSTVKEKESTVPGLGKEYLDVPIVGIENKLTDVDLSHRTQDILHDPAGSFHPFPISTCDYQSDNDNSHDNTGYHDNDEAPNPFLQENHEDLEAVDSSLASANANLNFLEPKTELIEFESDQEIHNTDSVDSILLPQNPYVLLKKLSSEKIQKYSRLQNRDTTIQTKRTSKSRCKVCLEKFNSEAELEIHCRVCILDNNSQPLHCSPSSSKKIFSSKSAPNHVHHITFHRTEEQQQKLSKFKYSAFHKAYSRPFLLANHMESHKETNKQTKPFKCDQCSASFLAKYNLTRHQAGHTLARPFQCTERGCEKTFKRTDHLQNHIKNTHSNIIELFQCPEPSCGSTLKCKESLGRHLRRCHTIKLIP